ncbi:MAG: glycosyltransferase family 9 protein [Candidatus Marinimicrobia bacterium]|nr:glycosyltransferase family 9 protein [Candidatus Neomarinimicrobiota bacterium]MBL7009633.1 glycosyltransferase family 9 protein [Candidatus Neomarinimicrobiota bacterium]MBL7029624.1 glycosyltransferase family 9 protein [Candidatus Neomarinimicrobiota bacterium]
MALPFLTACKQENPEATILVICKSWVGPIFENHPSVDGIVSFQKKDLNGYRSTSNSGQSLKSLDLDYFYLLSDSFRSAYLAKKSESNHRIGYPGQGRSGFLTQIIPRPKINMHRSKQYLNLLNGNDIELKGDLCVIKLLDEEILWAKKELNQIGVLNPIALFPFSVATSRSIPQLKILEILKKTSESIVIFGGKGDKGKAEILINASQKKNMISVAGHYNLRESMALISMCKGAIASDSGLGHISANLGVPTVSLFGAGNPELTRPIGRKTKVINENVHCSPCLKNTCSNREDPLLCLNEISPDLPLKAMAEILETVNSNLN